MKSRHKLMMLQHDAELRHFPDGFPIRRSDFVLAERETANYFASLYGAEVKYHKKEELEWPKP